jgi:hypothetical protein
MSDAITFLHQAVRFAHIALGFLGLIAFWVVIALPKGTRRHIAVGRVFAWCGLFVSLSGLATSFWAVVDLPSFLASLARGSTGRNPASQHAFIHMFFMILLYLSATALAAAVLGIRLARTQQRHDLLPTLTVRVSAWLPVIVSAILFGYGVWNGVLVFLGEHALSGPRGTVYSLCIVLGGLGFSGNLRDLRYVRGPKPTEKMGWLYKHIECMVGLAIAFHTAFLVFGGRRFIPGTDGPLQLVFWIAPSIIGVTLSNRWIRRYKRQYGDEPVAAALADPLGAGIDR